MITDDGENQDPYPKDEGDWFCQYSMRIEEVRMLYNIVCSHIEMFPGPPVRPVEELEYLKYLRNRLFAMMSDYNYTEMKSHEVDEP